MDYNKIYPNNKCPEFDRINEELKKWDDTDEAKRKVEELIKKEN